MTEGEESAHHEGGFAPPLATHWRALLLAVPFVFLTLILLANVVIPAIWQQPTLKELLLKPCVFRTNTGVPCPFCGATRATVLASRGQWLGSMRLHPAGVLLIIGGGLMALWCTACAVSGRDLGLFRSVNAAFRSITPRRLLWLLLLLWFYKIVTSFQLWPG